MKEFRVYTRAISAAEDSISYNNGCGADPADTSKLVFWAPLNDGGGLYANDQSKYNTPAVFHSHEGDNTGWWKREIDTVCNLSDSQKVLFKTFFTSTTSSYRYAFNGKEKDNETYGEGDEYDYGERIYDSRLGRWMSCDALEEIYPAYSPYGFALNTPIQAYDFGGNLVIFVNGFRKSAWQNKLLFEPMYYPFLSEKLGDPETIYSSDVFDYWGEIDNKFMGKFQDYNAVYADGTNEPLSSASERYEEGQLAAQVLIEQINSGKIKMQRDNAGNIIETIKIVGHSHGGAYSAGMVDYLIDHKFQVDAYYTLAPHQPGDIPLKHHIQESAQISRRSDYVSSRGLSWSGNSTFAQTPNMTHFYCMTPIDFEWGWDNGFGGHLVETYMNIFTKQNSQGEDVVPQRAPRGVDSPQKLNPNNSDYEPNRT
jgi:RHS repeat-associated protein